VEEHVPELDTLENAVVYGKRAVFIKCVPLNNFHGKGAFAYVSIDQEVQAQERKQIIMKASDFKSDEERAKKYRNSGVFIIVSKIKVDVKEILPLYYSRQAIEQVFDFSKNYANILPLRTHAETTFRGHLLVSFMATVAIMTIDRLFLNANPKSKKTKFNFIQTRSCLRQMKCNVYKDKIIVVEPDAACNAVIKALKVDFKKTISR
jgi:transposase